MPNKNIIILNKPISVTPLQLLDDFRQKNPKYKDVNLAYAGRLDPMASGLMLVLTGSECKNREKYQNLPKEYVFEVIFGFCTDTFDLMGLVEPCCFLKNSTLKKAFQEKVGDKLSNRFLGQYSQQYPPYSSFHINGKPLFWWKREGRINEINIPTKNVHVEQIELICKSAISSEELLLTAKQRVGNVRGDFRQAEIIKRWQEVLTCQKNLMFPVAKFRIACSSGTYVRSIVSEMGSLTNLGATTFSIHRRRIGEFLIE